MGIHVKIDWAEKRADMWICLSTGCVTYEEREDFVHVEVDDKRSDGLRIEKAATLKKREGWPNFIHDIINGNVRHTGGEPKADEGELLDAFRYISEKYKKGYWYVGLKTEFTTPRGIKVYFRARSREEAGKQNIIVELIAEKDWEKLVYQVYGSTEKVPLLLEEILKAIGAYVLFSEYVTKQPVIDTAQQEG